jgi:hypothetical protein
MRLRDDGAALGRNHLWRPAVLEAVPAIEQRLVEAGLLPVAHGPEP